MQPDEGWRDQRFYVGVMLGTMTGGTPLGSIENVFFRSSYGMDTDSMWGLRAGLTFAPRFDVEIEYGRSSPGINAILTDLAGQGKTEFAFADLDLSYVMGVVNYSLVERSRRIVPVLSVGYGSVGMSSTASEIAGSRQMGLVFGGGLRVRVADKLGVRADVRGLRTGFGPKQEEGQLPSIFRGAFNATNLYWTAGFEFRF
ncbi:MAG TPA: outer membrane beta-barrel protein [Acidobacteriota bacterium]|nr:outer membrane beta-barrel protein [Acidobacteriota bacterium]